MAEKNRRILIKPSESMIDAMYDLFGIHEVRSRTEAKETIASLGTAEMKKLRSYQIESIFEDFAEDNGVNEEKEHDSHFNDGVRQALKIMKKGKVSEEVISKVKSLIRK